MTSDLATFKAFGEALAIGLLVGIERYKSRSEGERKSAGVRTFPVIALLGAVCALLGEPVYALVSFGGLLLLLALGYWREITDSVGLTTETAALLTFWLGYLVSTHEALAVGTAIVLVLLLAHKETLHHFVRGEVTEVEFYDTLKFLLVVFVVYPLLPQSHLTRFEFVQPRQLWLLVILVSTISWSGYVLVRVLGGRRGLQLNALVGGLVSTTAVTVSLAQRAREAPELTRLFGVAAVMANAVQGPRLLVLVLAVDPALARVLAAPLLAFGLVGIGGAWVIARLKGVWKDEPPADVLLHNPYSFWPALKFALLFAVVLVASKAGNSWLGEGAVLGVSALAGLLDASAISISSADMARTGTISTQLAALSVLVAVAVNAAVKVVLAGVSGNRGMVFWLGGGLLTMVGVMAGLLALTG